MPGTEYAGGAAGPPTTGTLLGMSLLHRLLRVLPVTLVACVGLWVVSQNNDDYCGTVGECLGTAFDDMLVLGGAVLLGPALLWACRLPRVLGHTCALLLVGGCLWFGAGALTTALAGARPLDDTPLPLPVALAIGAVTALAASYAAGPGGRVAPRVGVLLAAPAAATFAHLVSEQLAA